MLPEDAQTELIARMAAALRDGGADPFLEGPILEPTDAFFPDPYSPDLAGLRTVARRLLNYAGLDGLVVEVDGVGWASDDPLAETSAALVAVDEHGIELAVGSIGDAEEVPLVLAHEVARAYRELRRARRGGHPYRAAHSTIEEEAEPDEREEEEVSLTAVLLGFGLLVALGSLRYKSHGELQGRSVITRWVHRRLGALTPDEAAFLLAAHAVVREVEASRLDAWRGRLPVDVRDDFTRYVARLAEDRPGLLDALGLPAGVWPATAPHPAPLPDDGWVPPVEEDDKSFPVLRRPQDAGRGFGLSGAAAGMLGSLGLGMVDADAFWPALLAAPLIGVGAYFVGRRIRRPDECSGCDAQVPDDEATRCPRCRGRFVGGLARGQTPAEAFEKLGYVIAPDGLVVEKQTDAAARYVERGVACPKCGWIPDGGAHWQCDDCEGEHFNTFAHGGECPDCGKVFEETLCPACEHLAPYEWWWPEDG